MSGLPADRDRRTRPCVRPGILLTGWPVAALLGNRESKHCLATVKSISIGGHTTMQVFARQIRSSVVAVVIIAVIGPAASPLPAATAGNDSPGSNTYPWYGNPEKIGTLTLGAGEGSVQCAAADTSRGYAYFGLGTSPGQVIKAAFGTRSDVPTTRSAVTLDTGEDDIQCAVVDPANGYAYFGTGTSPGRIVKVAVGDGASTPMRVGSLVLETGENDLASAAIDPEEGFAYFGTNTVPPKLVKVRLGIGSELPQRAGALTLPGVQGGVGAVVVDPATRYGYLGCDSTSTTGGAFAKVFLGDGAALPSLVGTLPSWSRHVGGVIDPARGFAYFSVSNADNDYGTLLKIGLGNGAALPTIHSSMGYRDDGHYELEYTGFSAPAIDVEASCVYLGATPEYTPWEYYVPDPPGSGSSYPLPQVARVDLGGASDRPMLVSVAELADSETPVTHGVVDCRRGVALFGTGTAPGQIVKLGTATAPAVGYASSSNHYPGESMDQYGPSYFAAVDSAGGFAYFGTFDAIQKWALTPGSAPPTFVGDADLERMFEGQVMCGGIMPSTGYGIVGAKGLGSYCRLVKFGLGSGGTAPSRVSSVNLPEALGSVTCMVIDEASGYAYAGTNSAPARVLKVAVGAGVVPPAIASTLVLDSVDGACRSCVLDAASGHVYFGTDSSPGRLVKVAIESGATTPTRVGALALDGSVWGASIDPATGYGYFGWGQRIEKVNLGTGTALPTVVGTAQLLPQDNEPDDLLIDSQHKAVYMTCGRTAGKVLKFTLGEGTEPPARVGAVPFWATPGKWNSVIDVPRGHLYCMQEKFGDLVKFDLALNQNIEATLATVPGLGGQAESVAFYSHMPGGNVRLAIYGNHGTSRTLLWQSASVANTAAGAWTTVPISSGTPSVLALPPGAYWLAFQADGLEPVAGHAEGEPGDGFMMRCDYGQFPETVADYQCDATCAKWSVVLNYSAVTACNFDWSRLY